MSVAAGCVAEQLSRQATVGFDRYVGGVEARIHHEHEAARSFLAPGDTENAARLRRGELLLERLTPAGGEALPDALLHDWRGTAFIPGAKVAEFEAMLRDFHAYPREFSPQVLQASAVSEHGELYRMQMRVQQRHVITVTLDGTYEVRFGRLDAEHGWSTSRSVRIQEIGANGRPLGADAEHGFLWRLDTWWSYEQRDGGLYVQMETVSLTRSVPPGLGWVVGPFVESVPRQSLEFTLRSACAAVGRAEDRTAE